MNLGDTMSDESPLLTVLRVIGALIPGDRLKTIFYLNVIQKPRRMLRLSLNSFYRMDHIYDVIREAKANYTGRFSILEFGVADGYALTKKLFATQYLGMADRITVHGFDTFEGMPPTEDPRDQDLIASDGWVEGQFRSPFDAVEEYCSKRYRNCRLHRGFFHDTLTDELLARFRAELPILIWIDCDYYTSARSVFERLAPVIPSGCVVYFDEYEFNYGSRFTGEARIVHEINTGQFGEGLQLVRDRDLSLNSDRVYRFINLGAANAYERLQKRNSPADLRRRSNDSPFP
jgi:hypothetical protein